MKLIALGGLELSGTAFARPKPLLLLAYVALEGPRDRRHLAELFWPEATDPLNSLSAALKQLRPGAPGLIESDSWQVWTQTPCDAKGFLEAAEAGNHEKALELYSGPFLNALYLPRWSAELEEWVYSTREILAGYARHALLLVAEAKAATGDFAEATKYAERAYLLPAAAQAEPEELTRLHTLLAAGQSPYLHVLRQEAQSFGFELLSADEARARVHVPPEHSLRAHLPRRKTSFIGRDVERLEIARDLARANCSLVTLTGPGGVGKTRLALEVGHDLTARFEGRVYFAALEALTSPEQIPSSIAEVLGLRLQGNADPLAQVMRHIGENSTLLILDNFEHLLAGAAVPAELHSSCPNLKLLVTSRECLNLKEEWILPLGGLAVAPGTAKAATHDDAAQLFLERAKRARLSFAPKPEDLPHIARICKQVQGLPLGIELAAAWVRLLPCREIAEEIAGKADFLTSSSRNVPERHRSMRAVFEGSWRLLTPKEQGVLGRLSVFRGGFTWEAAAAAAGTTISILASLVDKSLVNVSGDARYDIHPLLQQFSAEKLDKTIADAEQVREKHARYYFRFLEKKGIDLAGEKQQEGLFTIAEELENIRASWDWALEKRKLKELRKSSSPLSLFYELSGRFREGVTTFGQGMTATARTELGNTEVLSCCLLEHACHSYRLGLFAEAQQKARRGLERARVLYDGELIIRGLDILGQIAWQVGEFSASEQYLKEALTLAKNRNDKALIANLTRSIGWLKSVIGNHPQAQRYLLESLVLFRELNIPHEIANNLNALGYLFVESGLPNKAQQFFEEGLMLAQVSGTQVMIPHLLSGVGFAFYELGEYRKAEAVLEQALDETSSEIARAWVLVLLGRTATAIDDYTTAHGCFEQSLKLSWPAQMMPEVLDALVAQAELYIKQGLLSKAAVILHSVLSNSTLTGYSRMLAEKLHSQIFSDIAYKNSLSDKPPDLVGLVKKVLS